MKTSITVACNCGHSIVLELSGTNEPEDTNCPKCHTVLWFVTPLGDFIGRRILSRAYAELSASDFTLAILLSAMAVECELARLFIKWNEIDSMETGTPTDAQRESWAEQWRKWKGIAVRLDKACELLCHTDFNSFLSTDSVLTATRVKWPSVGLGVVAPKEFVIQQLFYRRNKIAHLGKIDYKQSDGEMAYWMALWMFSVMQRMDDVRREELNAKHAAN